MSPTVHINKYQLFFLNGNNRHTSSINSSPNANLKQKTWKANMQQQQKDYNGTYYTWNLRERDRQTECFYPYSKNAITPVIVPPNEDFMFDVRTYFRIEMELLLWLY